MRCLMHVLAMFSVLGAAPVASAEWRQELVLQDFMNRYVFPEELIGYDVAFPGTFPLAQVRFQESGRDMPYQAEQVRTTPDGNVLAARIHFRTSLDKRQLGTRRLTIGGLKEGSAAAKAGLLRGDVLISVNDQPVATQNDLRKALTTRRDVAAQFLVERDGQQVQCSVEPGPLGLTRMEEGYQASAF